MPCVYNFRCCELQLVIKAALNLPKYGNWHVLIIVSPSPLTFVREMMLKALPIELPLFIALLMLTK